MSCNVASISAVRNLVDLVYVPVNIYGYVGVLLPFYGTSTQDYMYGWFDKATFWADSVASFIYESRREKTGLRGFRQDATQTTCTV